MATSTVFCLPSPSSTISQSPMTYEEFKQKKTSSSSPSKSKSKAAPSSQAQTPSLPWLVQYWSSSLLQKPGMIMDQMFSCGAVDTTVATTVAAKPTKTFDTVKLDESYRINIEKNDTIGSHSIYFDETIANRATLPKPAVSPTPTLTATTSAAASPCTPFRKSNRHRKSKSLSEKWNDLRSVVASHDDTNSYDYYEDVMMSVSADDDRHNASKGGHPLSSCRQSKQESFRNYRKSSIVVDDDDEDDSDDDDTNAFIQDCDKWNDTDDDIRAISPFHNHENDDEEEDRDDEYDDDIRMAPPVSFSPTQSEVTAFRRTNGPSKGPGTTRISNNVNKRDSMNSINTNSYMNLHTCHSFDQYIDTTHYLCATSESEHVKIKGATGATVSPTSAASSSSSTVPAKKPGALRTPPRHQHTRTQTPEAYTTTAALKTGGAHPLRKSRTPPSPAKSTGADTYTTISLSHSYVHDFEQVTTGLENSELEEQQDQDVRDLSTSSSHASLSSLIEDLDTKMNGHSLFLDRLANEQLVTPPRTSTPPPPPPKSASLIRHGSPFRMKNSKSVSSHSKKEDNNIFGIVDDEQDDEDDSFADSSSAFRSLIRMQTQNYQLASSLSLSAHAAEGSVRAARAAARDGSVEESMEEEEEQPQDDTRVRDASQNLALFHTPSPTRGVPTSSPPSIVVPLHPHQRIIAPLPHRTESATFDNTDDNSEYTYSSCREATSSSYAQHPRPRQLFSTTTSMTTGTTHTTNTNTTNPANLAPMFPELW